MLNHFWGKKKRIYFLPYLQLIGILTLPQSLVMFYEDPENVSREMTDGRPHTEDELVTCEQTSASREFFPCYNSR